MPAFTLRPLIYLLITVGHTSTASGQAIFPDMNGASLEGVSAFDAHLVISAWLDVEEDLERFQRNAQTAFELGLRRDGVVVDPSAPNYLICSVSAAASASGLIAYTYKVEYYDFSLNDIHKLLWTTGGIATVGGDNFRAEGAAGNCVDIFANEWLKRNPG